MGLAGEGLALRGLSAAATASETCLNQGVVPPSNQWCARAGLSEFSQQPDPPLGLILGYGMLDKAKIKEGVRRLATHLPTLIRSQD